MMMLSGSSDCSVRLWSVYGEFLGVFGHKEGWIGLGPLKESDDGPATPKVPSDIRRVASSVTMRVLNRRRKSSWTPQRRLGLVKWIAKLSLNGVTPPLLLEALQTTHENKNKVSPSKT